MKKSFLIGIAAMLGVLLVLSCSTPTGGDGTSLPDVVKSSVGGSGYFVGIEQLSNTEIEAYELIVSDGKFSLTMTKGTSVSPVSGTVKSKMANTFYLEMPGYDDDGNPITVRFTATVENNDLKDITGIPYGFTHDPGPLTSGVAYLVIENLYDDFKVTDIELNGSGKLIFVTDDGFGTSSLKMVINYRDKSKPLAIRPVTWAAAMDTAKVKVTTNEVITPVDKTTDPITPAVYVDVESDSISFAYGKTKTLHLTRNSQVSDTAELK
jgi:hypothetical protein